MMGHAHQSGALITPSRFADLAVRVAVVRAENRTEDFRRPLKWCTATVTDEVKGITLDVEEFQGLAKVQAALHGMERGLIVCTGFGQNLPDEFLDWLAGENLIAVIVGPGSQSVLGRAGVAANRMIAAPQDCEAALRKAMIRLHVGQAITFKELTEGDLPSYLHLRYQVWQHDWKPQTEPQDYIDNDQEWEVNYTDLYATPIGGFTSSGELVACARIVRSLGRETRLASAISALVNGTPLKSLMVVQGYQHPFDMFDPFPGFIKYFGKLVDPKNPRRRLEYGEVSRVMVAPEWRRSETGACIAEALVDELVEVARISHYERLFLACQPIHQRFYARSGFRLIDGLSSERFGKLLLPAVAMDLDLD